MIISFIKHTQTSKRLDAMISSCKKFWVEYRIHPITNNDINNSKSFIEWLWDVIMWETSGDIKIYTNKNQSWVRSSFFDLIKQSGKILINHGLFINQDYKNKYTQQHHLQVSTNIVGIKTFIFHSLQWLYDSLSSKKISYPIIIKPTVWAKWEWIFLCNNQHEVEKCLSDQTIAKYIIQPFIKNSSDRRILVVWWAVLWIMRRTRKWHAFANNISQWGIAEREDNVEVYNKLRNLWEKIASSFQCNFVGIDIIYDETDKVYRFMEINTLPMRTWFESVYPEIIVTDEIVQLCQRLYNFQKNILIIKDTYLHNINYLNEYKAIHFSDRIGINNNIIKNIASPDPIEYFRLYMQKSISEYSLPKKQAGKTKTHKSIRQDIASCEYPQLSLYNQIFKTYRILSSQYKKNFENEMRDYIQKEDIIKYYDKLSNNIDHIILLSTSAINFFTYLNLFLEKPFPDLNSIFNQLEKLSGYSKEILHKIRIYTLTHYIIWLTGFYNHTIINKENYHNILQYLEDYITTNYWEISLDCKYEFLLCCKLLNYSSYLYNIIYAQSKKSLSTIDAYITDRDTKPLDTMAEAEHRNTLFLMVFGG